MYLQNSKTVYLQNSKTVCQQNNRTVYLQIFTSMLIELHVEKFNGRLVESNQYWFVAGNKERGISPDLLGFLRIWQWLASVWQWLASRTLIQPMIPLGNFAM